MKSFLYQYTFVVSNEMLSYFLSFLFLLSFSSLFSFLLFLPSSSSFSFPLFVLTLSLSYLFLYFLFLSFSFRLFLFLSSCFLSFSFPLIFVLLSFVFFCFFFFSPLPWSENILCAFNRYHIFFLFLSLWFLLCVFCSFLHTRARGYDFFPSPSTKSSLLSIIFSSTLSPSVPPPLVVSLPRPPSLPLSLYHLERKKCYAVVKKTRYVGFIRLILFLWMLLKMYFTLFFYIGKYNLRIRCSNSN